MMRERGRFWVTKYALTTGIIVVEAEVCSNISATMISVINGRPNETYHGEGKEWHRTAADAIKRANELRNAKIFALERQIAKLRELPF